MWNHTVLTSIRAKDILGTIKVHLEADGWTTEHSAITSVNSVDIVNELFMSKTMGNGKTGRIYIAPTDSAEPLRCYAIYPDEPYDSSKSITDYAGNITLKTPASTKALIPFDLRICSDYNNIHVATYGNEEAVGVWYYLDGEVPTTYVNSYSITTAVEYTVNEPYSAYRYMIGPQLRTALSTQVSGICGYGTGLASALLMLFPEVFDTKSDGIIKFWYMRPSTSYTHQSVTMGYDGHTYDTTLNIEGENTADKVLMFDLDKVEPSKYPCALPSPKAGMSVFIGTDPDSPTTVNVRYIGRLSKTSMIRLSEALTVHPTRIKYAPTNTDFALQPIYWWKHPNYGLDYEWAIITDLN